MRILQCSATKICCTSGHRRPDSTGTPGCISQSVSSSDVAIAPLEVQNQISPASLQPRCVRIAETQAYLPGFTTLMMYTCRSCGQAVKLSDVLDIARFFG
jgi:hypothetical protein